jgi:deferrochelatase/peroxidase EfeB
MTELELPDIQGFIVRGYRVNVARHFMLQIVQPAEAKRFLGRLVDGGAEVPQITTAERWSEKPVVFLNLGLTSAGLRQLGLEEQYWSSFPATFRSGAADPARASFVGDTGQSAPEHWVGGLGQADTIHIVLSLWSMTHKALEHASAQLRAAFAPGLAEQFHQDAQALDDNKVHFGYTDSIAQPTVDGAPDRKRCLPDAQPVVKPGEFLLGYPRDIFPPVKVAPDQLCRNSGFAAFRILEQDVAGFERFLAAAAQQTGLEAELVAAKVCGRWRNGVPLSLSPTDPHGEPPMPHVQINNFTYGDDPRGQKCPVGSHIRRTNPRDEPVTGLAQSGHLHRIVRRAMPYGPRYDPDKPLDQHERGLVGWFIGADLDSQFEFIMSSWVNSKAFARWPGSAHISGNDVLFGDNEPGTSSFTLPVTLPDGSIEDKQIKGFDRFVTTRGGAYCYLPSITAIKYLAALA